MLRGNVLRRLVACALAGAGVVWMAPALAQPPQYKNDAELMGAAIASPEGVALVLERLVQKCGLYGESTRAHGNAALRAWQARHREYLAEGRRVRAELQATYTDAQARERFDDLLHTQLPMLVERQFVVYARSIDDQPTEAEKADLCDGYFNAVDELQFDLKVNDPALAAFFDRRIAARIEPGSASQPDATAVPQPGSPAN
ncbi:hypothetical protein [Pandoraea apista]|uniref:Uncharacterized protein n=1 Tax=Pandoraea apista TaxID=93218 RepID=A0ABX9ZNB5_9BURK|nr:hypothetical protein [Pandoraea apista]PTD98978.1 hypothetical protein C7830_21675 [Pandoraea apista]RRJ29012.1 hypothetical protein EIB05_17730 [Pandoraea apista]RRJ73875.1 hypothetical protein EIL82_18480 [Pandoraea apista]RSD07721.1 hypothetical protein EJB12_17560 [Pandoraea apista]RSD12608.1 hypothetical protein EIZ52_20090 [Pandoraea apista]